jgi:hypothetical protein
MAEVHEVHMEDERETQRGAFRALVLPAAVVGALALSGALVTGAVLTYRGHQMEARMPPAPSAPAVTTGQSQPGAATSPQPGGATPR